MRIIEYKKIDKTKRSVFRSKKAYVLFIIILIALVYLLFSVFLSVNESSDSLESNNDSAKEINVDQVSGEVSVETDNSYKGQLRIFSGNEFRLLYDNLLQPNTNKVDLPPEITGNEIADSRIREIAEIRGYRLRSSPLVELPTVQGYMLQKSVHDPWKKLQSTALSEGHVMSIVSAFRSVDNQRGLFLSRLKSEGVSTQEIVNGQADEKINKVLVTTSIPGYSKHHTGYTVDLLCEGFVFDDFYKSKCNDWLSDNNYENAKTYGFIPSYPPDADLQGPEPEAWEYVYVGEEVLRN